MRKLSSQNCEKKLNSFFFKQFLTPTFCSRNEKGILWNACREKPLKVWKRFAQSLKKSWRPFFSRETFTQKLFLLTYNANSRRLPERLRPTCVSLLPKVQKNGQIYSFYPKKNICPQTKFWTVKVMLSPFLPKKASFKNWYLEK